MLYAKSKCAQELSQNDSLGELGLCFQFDQCCLLCAGFESQKVTFIMASIVPSSEGVTLYTLRITLGRLGCCRSTCLIKIYTAQCTAIRAHRQKLPRDKAEHLGPSVSLTWGLPTLNLPLACWVVLGKVPRLSEFQFYAKWGWEGSHSCYVTF